MPTLLPINLKRSPWLRRLLWGIGAYTIYALAGFLAVPPILKAQLERQLSTVSKRHVEIRQVRFNPLVLSVTVRGLSVTEPDGQIFGSWDELYANFQLSSLFRLAWTFDEIELRRPYGRIILGKDGSLNLANLIGDSPPGRAHTAGRWRLPRINVRFLHIEDGVLAWEDRTHRLPLETQVKPINLAFTNLSTRFGKDSQYRFTASATQTKSFSWTGDLTVQPFGARGHFEVAGFDLAQMNPFLGDYFRARISDGQVSIRADYALGFGGSEGGNMARAAKDSGFKALLRNAVVEAVGCTVKRLDSADPLANLPRLSAGPMEIDFAKRIARISRIEMGGPNASVEIGRDGSLSLARLWDPKAGKVEARASSDSGAEGGAARGWTVSVDDFRLATGSIVFADLSRSNRFATTLRPIQLQVKRFTTQPGLDAAYDLTATTDSGETILASGSLSVAPLRSAGRVEVGSVVLKNYSGYFEERLRGRVQSGSLSGGSDYRFALSGGGPDVVLSGAHLSLTNLQVQAADGKEMAISIPTLSMEQAEAGLRKRTVEVGLIKSTGGSVVVRRTQDGSLNLMNLLNAGPAGNTAPDAGRSRRGPPRWNIAIRDISFDNYEARLEDTMVTPAAHLDLDQISLDLREVNLAGNGPVKLSIKARANRAGHITVRGAATIELLAAEVDVGVSDLELRPFQPYVGTRVRLGIEGGRFNADTHVAWSTRSEQGLLRVKGRLGIAGFLASDQDRSEELVRWDDLTLSGVDLDVGTRRLGLGEVRCRGLKTSVIVGEGQRLNLQALAPREPVHRTSAAVPAPAVPRPAFGVQINAVVFENASFHFADRSIEPKVGFDVQEWSGSIKGLSSEEGSAAVVAVAGKVDAQSPFSLWGKVNPLVKEPRVDLSATLTNADLAAFTAYLEKYGGHPLKRGKLTLAVHYEVNDRQLTGANRFLLDYLTLGPRNDSPYATHLPVPLAIALLKDRNGRIDVSVPLSGRTDDPQFRIASVILDVVLNLAAKAATSPFSLLGAAFGGGEELSFVEFAPGLATIQPGENQKLDKLAKALYERPALNLEITGSFDPVKDRPTLARVKLERQLKVRRMAELSRNRRTGPSIDAIELDPAVRQRLMNDLLQGWITNRDLSFPPIAKASPYKPKAPAADPVAVSSLPAEDRVMTPEAAARALRAPNAASQPAGGPGVPSGPTPSERKAGAIPSAAMRQQAASDPLLKPETATPEALAPIPLLFAATKPEAGAGSAREPISAGELEARLLALVQVSADDQRDLIKARTQAVQAYLLKSGQVSADRLLLIAPKPVSAGEKGECRVRLGLE